MKRLVEFIKESLILEGGHSVEGAEPIRGDLAKPVADEVIKLVQSKFNCEMSALGSTGKKGADKTSGDIDIAIEYDWNNYKDILDYIKSNIDCATGNVNDKLHVFNIGYPYMDGNTRKLVQVDFMFTDSVEFAKFAYNSPDFTKNESKYKGMYQSTLLMAIVENTPVEDVLGNQYKPDYFNNADYDGKYNGELKSYWKLYFDQNDGLKAEHKSFAGKTKPTKNPTTVKGDTVKITKDISKILKLCFGDSATKETCKTFEGELAYITSTDYKYYSKEQLEKIKDTFLNDWQFKMKTDKTLVDEFEELFNTAIKNIK